MLVLFTVACSDAAMPTAMPITQTPAQRAERVVVATLTPLPTTAIVFVVTRTPTPTPTIPPALLTQAAAITYTAEAEYAATLTRIAQESTALASATFGMRTRIASNALPLPSDARLVFGPSSGSLEHDPNDNLVKVHHAENAYLRDGIIEARFYTPYTEHDWSHGFFFRDTNSGKYCLVISSDRRYALIFSYPDSDNNWQFERIQSGYLPDYTDLSPNSSILVRLVVQGDRAHLFINSEEIGTLFDLSRHQSSGMVRIGTGFYNNSEKASAVISYELFTVWSLDPPTPVPTLTPTPTQTFTRSPTPTPTRTRTRTPVPPTRTPVPPRAQPRLCPNSPPPRLAIGDIGYVVYGYGPSNLNKHPRRSGDRNVVVDILQEGDTFRVVGGPQCGNGLTWWQVRYLKNNFLGWLAEGEGNTYWLDRAR
jgi:hypothetical protein